ncbi:MAG: PorV/PorQ family protein [Bacteroidota bacterium]
MKKYLVFIILLCLFVSGANAQDRQKLAQAGFKFLNYSSADPKSAALGEAVTSLEGGATSLFYNPAGVARQENMIDLYAGQSDWIADINYMFAAASFSPFGGNYGVFGVTFSSVDYGDFIGTRIVAGGYEDVGTFSPKALSVGIGYAKALSDKFSVGGNIKYVKQSLGNHNIAAGQDGKDYDLDVAAFDFGVIYKTGFKSLNFGMNVRNFSQEIEYVDESFQLPLTFKIGLSMNLIDLTKIDPKMHSFILSVDANKPRDFKEQISIGGEYTFFNTLSLRFGYTNPTDEMEYNLGVGLKQSYAGYTLGLDYAYTAFGVFGNLHRFGINMSL